MGLYHRSKFAAKGACRLMAKLRNRDKIFIVIEFCICLSLLILFTLAYPDRYRSKLWENGGVKGWNSSPKMRIYFYANHKQPPEIPFIWTQRLTDSNLAMAILSFIIHCARAALLPLNFLPLWIESIYDLLLVGLWAISVAGQASGDFSDANHISYHPWYLTHSCGQSWVSTNTACHISQASFGLSVVAVVLYLCRTGSHLLDTMVGYQSRCFGTHKRDYWDEDRGGLYADVGTLRSYEDSEPLGVQEALSPVLAFFPSESKNVHG